MAINSLSYSSKGFSGLASGMDTESMVKKLLAGTQTKIDRQTQKKTQLTYKQDLYRGVTSKLRSFKDSYFSYSNPATNLNSDAFFNTMNTKYTSGAFKVTATGQANAGTTRVDRISQLAKAATMKSSATASGRLEGTFNEEALKRFADSMDGKLVIAIGDAEAKNIDISSLAGLSSSQAETELNKLLQNAGIDLKASFQNNAFSFSNASGNKISIKTDGKGAHALLGKTAATEIAGTGSVSTTLNTEALLPSITVTLDGVNKTIAFNPYDAAGNASITEIAKSIQDGIAKAHGGGVTVTARGGKLEFVTADASRQIQVGGAVASLDVLGLKAGQSNKINTNMAINKMNFSTALQGDEFKFSINGVDFNITADRSLNSVISEINNSKANVKITYNAVEDKFTMVSTVSGKESDIKIDQKQGNFLNALFGDVGTGSGVSSKTLYGARTTLPNKDAFTFPAKGGTFNITVAGKDYELKVPEKSNKEDYTAQELVDAINTQLASSRTDAAVRNANIRLTYDATTGEAILTAKAGADVRVTAGSDNILRQMGFAANASTQVSGSTTLAELGIENDIYFKGLGIDGSAIGKDWSIDQMTTVLQAALRAQGPANAGATVEFDASSARFRIFGVDMPMDFSIEGDEGALFGSEEITFNRASTAHIEAGQNAKLTVNGVEVERNSNNFTLEGLQFELLTTTQKLDDAGNPIINTAGDPVYEKAADIDVTRDTDKIYDGIVKFVESYNEVIKEINKLVKADATYKDYAPLTAEQKASLSDREVEMWEAKAREGLLRSDSVLQSVLTDMRNQLYQKSGNSTLALYNIGITTNAVTEMDKATTGTLTVEPTTLRKMINENPDELRKLFTSSDGLAANLDKAISRAVSTTPGSTGSLVRTAGVTGSPDTTSSIYRQIREINSSLRDLEDRYESEYNRYWRQFSSMEQTIQSMNQQSSWLSQQFAS